MVQIKVPVRLVREAFQLPEATLDAAAASGPATVAQADIVVHMNGQRQPGSFQADVRVISSKDAYLSTSAYGERAQHSTAQRRRRRWRVAAASCLDGSAADTRSASRCSTWAAAAAAAAGATAAAHARLMTADYALAGICVALLACSQRTHARA